MKNPFSRVGIKTKLFLATSIAFLTFGIFKIDAITEDPENKYGCPPTQPGKDLNNLPTEALYGAIATLNWLQYGGTINDASCLNETPVHGVINITSESDIADALTYAKQQNLTVSIAGARHSMGGHAFQKNGLVLDMGNFNAVAVNEDVMTMRVQSGATWHDIQNILHPNYAVSAMQSTDIFSVGGSISVNAHGMDHNSGAVENSIVSMRVMLPNGKIVTTSRTENTDLYETVVGGYGLAAVILDAELKIVPNDVYESERMVMPFNEFPTYFETHIKNDTQVGLMYTHISTAPTTLLDESIVYVYRKTADPVTIDDIPPLQEVSSVKLRRFFMNMSKSGSAAQQLRWWAEKYLEPRFESCSISRTNAISSGEACFVARNEPMHDSVPYLYNNLVKETDILHEYFIPRENIVPFIDDMRTLVKENDINLLNASVRVVHKERGLLTYAPEPAYSVVLFINQPTTAEGNHKMERDTQALIDITHKHNGRFFLPYQLHYSKEQLTTSYPELPTFLAQKRKYDPDELLSSTFYNYIKD